MIKAQTSALILVAALLTACVSTPRYLETPPALPRAKPSEDMAPCVVNSCVLPSWYDEASEADQASVEMNCAIVNAAAARECARRHARLAEWISAAP